MLAGEYAVLDGGDAWCLAVNRRARVDAAPAPEAFTPPEARQAWARAVASGLLREMPTDGAARFDLSALGGGGRKLGLGSSAAGAVAGLGWAVAQERGAAALRDLIPQMAQCAREGHRAAQGGGSGVDVLTAAYGGLVWVRFPEGPGGVPAVERHALPESLVWRVFWSGTAVRTSEMIARVEALRAADASAHRGVMDAINAGTTDFGRAVSSGNAAAVVAAARAIGAAMAALGTRASAPVVTPPMARLAARAEQFGAAVKPSGAGGGDVVVAFAQDASAMDAVRAAAIIEGFEEVDLAADGDGVVATDTRNGWVA